MTQKKAFSGVRVYDATQGVAGPHATMLLALHGADVVKIEPMEGDWCRVLGQTVGEHCAHSVAFNRGKRSIAFDMKKPEGREIARRLAARADVFAESFRPGVISRLGMGYEDMRKVNPKIVYASVSGFGQTGPYGERPTVDGLIQAFSGMMVMNRTADGLPHRMGMIAVDVLTGLYMFQALSTAIIRQIRFGEGSYIDGSMMQATAAFQAGKITEDYMGNGNPPPLYVPAGMFKTSDGYLVLSTMRDAHYKALCEVVGRPDLASDPRYASKELRTQNAAPMMAEFHKELAKKPTDEWLKLMHKAGVMAERVNSYEEWRQNEHVQAVRGFDWVEQNGIGRIPVANIPGLPKVADDVPGAQQAPGIGEHSRTILGEIGYAPEEVEKLIVDKVVRAAA